MTNAFRILVASAVLFASLVLSGCGPAGTPGGAYSQLPADFQVDERVISFTTTFDILSDGKNYGSVSEHMLSLTRSFTYTDGTGAKIATARARLLSWGTHIDVYDAQGKLVGSIKEEVFSSLFKVHTVYSILDASGALVAKSEKVEFISTSMKLTDPAGNLVATLDRPWLNWTGDTWTVSVKKQGVVDPRIIVMIGAYKTSVDNQRRRDEDSKNSSDKKSSAMFDHRGGTRSVAAERGR